MSRTAVRATAALLCGVVLVALGLAFIGLPDSESAPESLRVDLDFDTFEPGVTQTRTSPIDVPVPSRVAEARVESVGPGVMIRTELTLCHLDSCEPLRSGSTLEPGPYTLVVDATLDGDVAPGSSGTLIGEIRVVETHQSTKVDTRLLMAVAGGGLLAIAIGGLALQRRPGVAA